MLHTHKKTILQRGNLIRKPKQSKETHHRAKENSQATEEAVILNAPKNQKRGHSPKKIIRIDESQGTNNTIRKVLQELDCNALPMPRTSKKQTLSATTEDRLITS